MMGADPDFYIQKKLAKTKQGLGFFDKDALAEYMRCFRNPATSMPCARTTGDLRVDLDMDTADFAAGRKIACPLLLLWGASGGVGRNHKPAEIWSRYVVDIRGAKALPCGHYCRRRRPRKPIASCASFFAAP